MKRITLIMCVLLSVLMACGQKQRKTVAKSTTVSSFTVKSLECNDSSSYADVSLRVDWPQGNSSLARKVRSYLKSQLDSVLSINAAVRNLTPLEIVDAVTDYSRRSIDRL